MAVYRELVPHYALVAADSPIYQSFVFGRVRVVMTDTRAARTKAGMLGEEQGRWFLDQLRSAADSGQLVLWVSSVPWITAPDPGSDDWGGYPEERDELAAAVRSSGAVVVMLGGDAHMVAIDDGTNNTYGGGGAGFVVFHAGALDRPGSVKGGPYSEGAFPGGGQFGLVEIDDDGTTMTVTLRGLDWEGSVLVEHTLEVEP
jgi:phosphodiesterase/alkaline phosphatase D-like protein